MASVWAIGDVHGEAARLSALLDELPRQPGDWTVFLGDYIDRGPDSAGVLATVRRLQEGSPESVVCLMGNHEALLLQAAADLSHVPAWL